MAEQPEENYDQVNEDEINDLKIRIEAEAAENAKLDEINSMTPKTAQDAASTPVPESGPEVDKRSIFVSQVDYAATPDEINQIFSACGVVNRVTIPVDKFSGQAKGFAYVEFADVDGVANALMLGEPMLRSRALKIIAKRTNVPSFMRGGASPAVPRSRRGRGRGRGRGAYGAYPMPMYPPVPMYGYAPYAPMPYGRARGGGYRNRRASYAPY